MLNAVIRFSLQNRSLIAALALFILGYGGWQAYNLPIDVFPALDRPRVVILTEAPGLAPEEVETRITFPIETVLNGATGVQAVRTSSGVGISVVYVEFDWDTEILQDRQIVNERLALVANQLPQGIQPQLAPISSIMGQILVVGMHSEGGKTSPMALRTLADWVVRQRLLTISGVSQVFVMGGERKQFQVLVDPSELVRYDVTLDEIKTALLESNQNSAGGYLDEQGPNELLVRALGRIHSLDDLQRVVVKQRGGQSLRLMQVARVVEGAQVKRGDSSSYVRAADGRFVGGSSVVLTINKQPAADTRAVTDRVVASLREIGPSLPADVRIHTELYHQKTFIDLAIENILGSLREGAVLVAIILFLFLLNVRTTFITLTAIPLSIVLTALVFKLFGLSVNTMTLGGLAVALGDLTDDAIVDVENIYRRLKENARSLAPKPPLLVVFQASAEVRNSIVYATLIVILVFLPLFALSGMEGRLFTPLGIAYVVSLVASLLVSMTLTPVLSYWLLPRARLMKADRDSLLMRGLKWLAGGVIRFSLWASWPILLLAAGATAAAFFALGRFERDFLPPFDEGAVQINVLLPPGASLARSNELVGRLEQRLREIDDIDTLVRKTGRAELDEHAEGVNVTEMVVTIDPNSARSRAEVLDEISEACADVPGIVTAVEQPLAHLISHMLSGVKAQVAIKLFGDDLHVLRRQAEAIKSDIAGVPGVRDLQIEPQVLVPQLRIEIDGGRLERYGLRRGQITELVETAMQGHTVSQIVDGQRTFDLVVRLDERYREDLQTLRRLLVKTPSGQSVKLEDVARIYPAGGPNTINREQVRRRIIVQCNVGGRGLVDVVEEIERRLAPLEAALPTGYFVEYSGQFQSQQSASRLITVLAALSLLGTFLVLYKMFRSANLALQVMVSVPMAFIGGVVALAWTGQTLTIASMVGFISLCGIATRNGIMLIDHYLHLVEHEGESWSAAMIVRAGQNRLAPVLMTALTGIGLVPLVSSGAAAGKEILYPVATVILGGLVTSTTLEFFVRPALFWRFGMRAAKRVVDHDLGDVKLVEEDKP